MLAPAPPRHGPAEISEAEKSLYAGIGGHSTIIVDGIPLCPRIISQVSEEIELHSLSKNHPTRVLCSGY